MHSNPSRGGADVPVHLLAQLLRYAAAKGLGAENLLEGRGLSAGALSNPDGRIGAEAYAAVQDEAARLLDDPSFGLHLGLYAEPWDYSVIGYIMLNCATLGEALRMMGRYARLLGSLFEWKTIIGLRRFTSEARPIDREAHISRHCVETAFAGIVKLMRSITGKELNPLAVRFAASPPPDLDEYSQAFGCIPRFDCDRSSLTFDMALASLPIIAPNPALRAHLEPIAERLLAAASSKDGAAGSVERILSSRLDGRIPSLREAAAELGMSSRSLQYRLREEGTDFSALLRRMRTELAREQLRRGRPIVDVAFCLGFADASAFSKAFKSWTGTSPSEFRSLPDPRG